MKLSINSYLQKKTQKGFNSPILWHIFRKNFPGKVETRLLGLPTSASVHCYPHKFLPCDAMLAWYVLWSHLSITNRWLI